MLNALLQQSVSRAASDTPVVWALLGIITTLTTALGLFIRSVLRERDYWREAFFVQQKHNQELMMPTAQVVQMVMSALPSAGPPTPQPSHDTK